MARVFFVTRSKGGLGKSVGAIALLDYLDMRSRKVSLVETDSANPDIGDALKTSSIGSVAMIPPNDDLLNFILVN
jgi:cellulose biosynthesis protein BcsQ